MSSIINTEELRAARRDGLEQVETVVRGFAKRAPSPAMRQAMAELEETMSRVRKEWTEKGLVEPAAAA